MRTRRRGHVLTITSIGGLRAFPGLGLYNATKFALDGISEALALEVGPLGIRVTAVEPGAFRTDWAGRSMVRVASTIADYDATAGEMRRAVAPRTVGSPAIPRRPRRRSSGWSPTRIHRATSCSAPMRSAFAQEKLELSSRELEDVSQSTDFPG